MNSIERHPGPRVGRPLLCPPPRPAKPVSFWTAVDLIMGAIAAAAIICMILEGI